MPFPVREQNYKSHCTDADRVAFDQEAIQDCLSKTLFFNIWKLECEPASAEHESREHQDGRAFRKVTERRDLGVHGQSSLKVESQVDMMVKKAFDMLSFIGQNIEYRSCTRHW